MSRVKLALLFVLLGTVIAAIWSARRSVVVAKPPENFDVKTDNVPQAYISGRIVYAGGEAKGTVFLLHGYTQSKEIMAGYNWMAGEGWDLVSIDFREHGKSTRTRGLSTLGYYEIYDLKAAIDLAEAKGLPKPYVIYGNSMGASIGLRWAGTDRRIKGVFAVSPFANAYVAAKQFLGDRAHVKLPFSPAWFSKGYANMLREVDQPTALRQREDLRITICSGEWDCFPLADQHAILNASPSPAAMKKLYVMPSMTHGQMWAWKGDSVIPSHDDLVRQFLRECATD